MDTDLYLILIKINTKNICSLIAVNM